MYGSVLSDQLEKLDLFFHRKLKKAKIWINVEDTKQELIQETAAAVYEKLQREKYGDYNLQALIWLKAVDVWTLYVRSLHHQRLGIATEDVLAELGVSDDFLSAFEATDWLLSIRAKIGEQKWRILIMYLQGVEYIEIAASCAMTENAIRVLIHRLKHQLQKPF